MVKKLTLQIHGNGLKNLGSSDARIEAFDIGPNRVQTKLPEWNNGEQKTAYKCGVLATLGLTDKEIETRIPFQVPSQLKKVYEEVGATNTKRRGLAGQFLAHSIYVLLGDPQQHLEFDDERQVDILVAAGQGKPYDTIAEEMELKKSSDVTAVLQRIKSNNGISSTQVLYLAGLVEGTIPLPELASTPIA